MKRIFYDIGLFLFPVVLRIIGPFHTKARLMTEGRKDWEEELKQNVSKDPKVWFHCASLGEFEQGRPLIEQVKKEYPTLGIFITFFSPSGYEAMKDYQVADYVGYLPFDSKKNAFRFIKILQPDIVIFIKYEFWFYFLTELKEQKIPTFSVSSIFRKEQQFFKKNGHFFRRMLESFEHFFVQNESSKLLLQKHKIENVTVSGDTRFDRVQEICNNSQPNHIAGIFKGQERVLVIGSSWPDDMEVLYPIINDSGFPLKYIVAPHEIGSKEISKMVKGLTVSYQLYSEADLDTIYEAKVLVIDNIGLLSSLYQYGEIAYIGGAFWDGLHNILEPATFGKPVLFGRAEENKKFQEAIDLLKLGGAIDVSDTHELKTVLSNLIEDKASLEAASKICFDYVNNNAGATKLIMNHLYKYLN